MSQNVKQNCTVEAFFSNPHKQLKKEPAGTFYANNAMWIQDNRFSLSTGGDEKKNCRPYYHNSELLNCFMNTKDVVKNCDEVVPDGVAWG